MMLYNKEKLEIQDFKNTLVSNCNDYQVTRKTIYLYLPRKANSNVQKSNHCMYS